MPLTLTQGDQAIFTLDRMRGVVMDVTFDATYPTGGELLPANDLGFLTVIGGWCVAVRTSATPSAAATTMILPIYNPITGSLQAYETGDTVSTPLDEVGNGENISGNTYTMLFLGF